MKKLQKFFFLLLSIVAIFCNDAHAQCNTLPPKNINTNPDNYVNEEDPTNSLLWDWRLQSWMGYRPATPFPANYQINSPFYNIFNPNLFDLSSPTVKNYDPLNGR